MKRKTLLRIFTFALILAVILGWFFYALPSLKVATGYTAKYVCSSSFVGKHSLERISSNLNFFPVNKVKFTVDTENKVVRAALFGLARRTASYYEIGPNCGCVLGNHELLDEWVRQYPPVAKESVSDTLLWPFGSRLSDSIPPGVDIGRLRQVMEEEVTGNPAILAVTAAYKNILIAEAYGEGIDQNTSILGWSMTKTISNALFGILAKNGQIKLDDPAGIPDWERDERKEITVNDLLQMSSGLKWKEDYSSLSHVTRMLYLESDFYDYAIRSRLVAPPGSQWLYSSGTTNILSGLIRLKMTGDFAHLSFPYDSLFNVIGMKSAVIELDNAGNPVYSSYGWATARDWTRFGLLYLREGDWFGRQIFNRDWAQYSVRPAPASNGVYGAQIWLNRSGEKMPSIPTDAYYESGYGGQRVLVVPSKDLVVVLMSGRQKDFDFDGFYVKILECFDD